MHKNQIYRAIDLLSVLYKNWLIIFKISTCVHFAYNTITTKTQFIG